jgi:hypothetical protein
MLWTSKSWLTKFEDPNAPRQRWRCGTCGANYKAGWGVLVQVRLAGSPGIYYMKAEVPDPDALDARALMFEKKNPQLKTAAQIYAAVPTVAPTLTEMVLPVCPEKGGFKLASHSAFEALPDWSWDQIWTFAGK